MGRIGAHISGFELRLLNTLRRSEAAANLSSLRLATGRQINDPSDDPGGFVQVSGFEQQLAQIQAASSNVTAANSVASQTQLSLDQIRTELDTIRSLLLEDEDQSLTAAQRADNQLQIDEALEQIRTIAGTPIDGLRRLDGSTDFRIADRNRQQVRGIQVHSPGIGTITGQVHAAATQATLTYTGTAGQVTSDATFTLSGRRGSTTISVNQNDDLDDVAATINQQSHATGVTADVDSDELTFTSVDHGSSATVQVDVTSGTFDVSGGDGNGSAVGRNADMTINGVRYRAATNLSSAALEHNEASGQLVDDVDFTIDGPDGSVGFSESAGTSLTVLASAIAAQSGTTGVTASTDITGTTLTINTVEQGSTAAFSVQTTSGTLDLSPVGDSEIISSTGNSITVRGADDTVGSSSVDGTTVTVGKGKQHFKLELASGFKGILDPINVRDEGVQRFALSPDVARSNQLAIPGVLPGHFDGESGSLLDIESGGSAAGLGGNTSRAIRIVDEALGRLTVIEGRVDGFANSAVATSSSFLTALEGQLHETIDEIDQVDVTKETLLLNRYDSLAANSLASLNILQDQRTRVIDLLQQIAIGCWLLAIGP